MQPTGSLLPKLNTLAEEDNEAGLDVAGEEDRLSEAGSASPRGAATLWHTHTGAVRGDRTPWTPDTPAAAHPALRV